MKGNGKRMLAWVVLGLLLGSLAAGVWMRGGAVEWFAFIVIAGMLLLSISAPLISIRKVQVLRKLLQDSPVSGGELGVELTVRSSFIVPMVWIAVKDEAKNETNPGEKPVEYRRVVLPWFSREFTLQYVLRPLRRGELLFCAVHVTVGDMFGLITRQVSIACESRTLVLPEPIREDNQAGRWVWSSPKVNGAGRKLLSTAGENEGTKGTGLRPGSGHDLRAYAAGDPLRCLDWRSMAKGRGWHIRTETPAAPVERIIVLDRSVSSYGNNSRLFDACVSRALWGARQSLVEGAGVLLLYDAHGKDALRSGRERPGRYLARAAVQMARLKADSGRPADEAAFNALKSVPRGATIICVSAGSGDWKALAQFAASRGCRLELWLTAGGKTPAYSLRERIRVWESCGCRIRLWMLPEGEVPLTEALEGGMTDAS
ncbi:DUF58 domain-containing protein [Paenibacillus tarimensis]